MALSDKALKYANDVEVRFLKYAKGIADEQGHLDDDKIMVVRSPDNPFIDQGVAEQAFYLISQQGAENSCTTLIAIAKNLSEIKEKDWDNKASHLWAYLTAFAENPIAPQPKEPAAKVKSRNPFNTFSI